MSVWQEDSGPVWDSDKDRDSVYCHYSSKEINAGMAVRNKRFRYIKTSVTDNVE